MIKYRLDLRDFLGHVILKGADILHGSKPDGSDAAPSTITERGLDTRTHCRYLFSDKPFAACGKVIDGYQVLAEEI